MPAEPAFTLGDLLDQEELALELCVGGEPGRRRRVAGAHSIEIERPSTWLGPDWIMLTTGVRLRDNAEAQRELVRELDEAGAAALGLGLELGFKRVPTALLEEAAQRGFPVFAVPLRTPFREIVTAINRALLSSDLRTYQRLASMQLYLVDALREPEPRRAVVDRLAELLEASVLVLDAAGRVELAAGDAPAEVLWRAIGARPTALHELDVEGWHAVATPVIAAQDEPREWLVVASRRSAFNHGLTKPIAQAAAPLLAATERLNRTQREQQQAIEGALLAELIDQPPGTEPHSLKARTAALGIDFSEPARVVVLRGMAAPTGWLAADGVAVVQVPRAQLRAQLGALLEARPGARAGIGRPVTRVEDVPHSHRDAQLAVQHVEQGLLDFEDFELALLLLAEAPPDRIQPKVDEWVALLRARPMLWEAIVAYFQHDLDVVAAARALHLHPNSLRYRLGRVERLLGRSLKQPATIAGLYVAIIASPHP